MTPASPYEDFPEFIDVFIVAMMITLPISALGLYGIYKILAYYDI